MHKHDWTDIIIATGTVLFTTCIVPICDSLSTLLISAVNKRINKMQIDMQLDKAEGEAASEVISPSPSITQAIGFAIPTEEEYYEEDDDE